MTLASSLSKKGVKLLKQAYPLWKGPEEDGITQSLLSRFLVCRERFRLLVVEGIRAAPTFNFKAEFGNLWHVCEEHHANNQDHIAALLEAARKLTKKFPTQQAEIEKCFNLVRTTFPIYVKFWSQHRDVKQRLPVLQEQVFRVPYKLPSGRVITLRGKWDSVDIVTAKRLSALWIQENKTKGRIEQLEIQNKLRFDLQSMLYLVALREAQKLGLYKIPDYAIAGVRYNVIRRPLSGGKHGISQLQNVNRGKKDSNGKPLASREETLAEYYERLGGLISEEPEYYFHRWNTELLPHDLELFEQRFLWPIGEQLCNWWEWMLAGLDDPFALVEPTTQARKNMCFYHLGNSIHWQHPHGVYNVLNEGGNSEVDEYLATGSMAGLSRVESLFTELTE